MISVCLPTYNRAEYLAEAIESIINQTYKNWELIVLDDGSTDSTEKLMEYYTKNPQIKYFKTKNQGIAKARNTAISHAVGDYIMVMDSDDVCGPDRMKRQLAALQKKDYDVCYSSYLRADENLTVIDGVKAPQPKELTKENLLKDQGIPHVTIMAKRRCFTDHPYLDKYKVNDDYQLVVSWVDAGYTMTVIEDPLVIVRFHEQNTSRTSWEEIKKINEEVQEGIRNA